MSEVTQVVDPTLEAIKVAAVGPHGVRSGETWYKVGEPLKSSLQKGGSYYVRTSVGPKGGKIITAIENVLSQAPVTPVLNPELNKATFTKTFYKKSAPKDEDKMSKAEWQEKDIRISRSGVIQSAVKAVSPHVAKGDQILAAAIPLAEGMLEWVNGIKKGE